MYILSDIQLLLHIVQVDGQDTADALLLHGDAVEDVGLLHSSPAMGDDDELGLIGDVPHIPGKAHHVVVVQGGLDLIHHHKGGGTHLQNGEIQSRIQTSFRP